MLLERIWLGFNLISMMVIAIYAVIFRAMETDAPGADFILSDTGGILVYLAFGISLLVNSGLIVYGLSKLDRKLVFRNEAGEITVSLRAVETALSQAASSLDDVHKVVVKIRIPPSGRGTIKIDALGTLNAITDLRVLTQHIQALIKMQLTEMLQIEGDLQFNVHFCKTVKANVQNQPRPVAKKTKPQSTERTESLGSGVGNFPFRYPVDSDDD